MSFCFNEGEKQLNKVILFGLDGASFNLIRPWVQKGHLPAFARLFREGTYGVLKSTYPPVTVPAWASMLTGNNPGRLGYCDFSERKNGSYHFGSVNIRWDEINPVWKIVSDLGMRVCVFNVPTTPLPTYPLNGASSCLGQDHWNSAWAQGGLYQRAWITCLKQQIIRMPTTYHKDFPHRSYSCI